MAKSESYRPRLSVELDDPQDFVDLRNLFPHGLLKPFFNVLVKEVIDLLTKANAENKGEFAIAVVIQKKVHLRELLPTLNEIRMAVEESDEVDT